MYELEWDEPDRSWIGVILITQKNANLIQWTTTCTSDDFDFVAGGPDSEDGSFKFILEPEITALLLLGRMVLR